MFNSPGTKMGRRRVSPTLDDQIISGGVIVMSSSLTTGSITVDCGTCPLQYITNNGAFTIAAPTKGDGSCVILVTNGASAGGISFTGFTVSTSVGDTLTTTNGNRFMIYITRISGISVYAIRALQ